MSLYYESLCPDSVRFVVGQLYPGYEKLGDVLDLDFVPYGFATVRICIAFIFSQSINLFVFLKSRMADKRWYFSCQHGPHECYGNKLQACSLQQNVTQKVHMNFINCVMKNPDPASAEGAEDVRIFLIKISLESPLPIFSVLPMKEYLGMLLMIVSKLERVMIYSQSMVNVQKMLFLKLHTSPP